MAGPGEIRGPQGPQRKVPVGAKETDAVKRARTDLPGQPAVTTKAKDKPAYIVANGKVAPELTTPNVSKFAQVAASLQSMEAKLAVTPKTPEEVEALKKRLQTPASDSFALTYKDEEGKEQTIHPRLSMLETSSADKKRKLLFTRFRETQGTLQEVNKERQADLEKLSDDRSAVAQKKAAEAQQDRIDAKKSSFWGKVFGWVAVVVSVIVAIVSVAIAVLTVGAGTPLVVGAVLAVIAAVTALTAQILNETGAITEIAKAIANMNTEGMTKSEIQKKQQDWEMALGIGLAVVSIAAGIAGAVFTGGASVAGSVAQVSSRLMSGLQIAKLSGTVIESGSTIAKAGSDIHTGVKTYQAAQAESEKILIEGDIERLRFYMDSVFKLIERSVQKMNESFKQESQDIKDASKSLATVIGNASI